MRDFLKATSVTFLLLAGTLFFLCSTWALLYGGGQADRTITVSGCWGGRTVGVIFAGHRQFTMGTNQRGERYFPIWMVVAAVPGSILSYTRAPFCLTEATEKDIEKHIFRFWADENHQAALQAGVIDALVDGYERAEKERRERGGRVLDDTDAPPEVVPGEDEPEDETAPPIPEEEEDEDTAPIDPLKKQRNI